MKLRKVAGALAGLVLATGSLCRAETHPILPIGSAAPDFALPGIDGKTHRLSDYGGARVLVVVFTCNHCPIAQLYETRIARLAGDYRDKGVAVVAIQPNAPEAIRVDELDCSDVSDSLEEMKIRAAYKKITYPYLYDGETQSAARAYGPQATPHVFVFDQQRRLRYEGRMDNSYRVEQVKTEDARNAIDTVLAGEAVAVPHTGVFGCSTKWREKEASRLEALKKIESQPVTLDMVSAGGLKELRANRGGRLTLVSFWATWCGSCIHEFPDIETTYRMYKVRDFDLVTVAANMPDERPAVQRMLEKQHATGRNLLFASDDIPAMQKAFDPEWESAVPYTALLGPDGKMLYRKIGEVDILELRRAILANMHSEYIGFNRYWSSSPQADAVALPDFYKRIGRLTWLVKSLDGPVAGWKALGLTSVRQLGGAGFGRGMVARAVTGNLGSLAVDMVQPAPGAAAFNTFLEAHGDGVFSVVHEVATREEMAAEVARLRGLGVGVLETLDGGANGPVYTFFDTEPQGKYVLGLAWWPGHSVPGGEPRKVTHIAFVIRDPKPVSAYWTRLGFPEMPVAHASPRAGSTYHGRPLMLPFDVGWHRYSKPTFEWIIPPQDPLNCYADALALHGEGVHHLGLPVDDLEQAVAAYGKLGHGVLQSGGWGQDGQKGSGRYAYMDTEAIGGVTAELIRAIN
jgi:peroxiredoxin